MNCTEKCSFSVVARDQGVHLTSSDLREAQRGNATLLELEEGKFTLEPLLQGGQFCLTGMHHLASITKKWSSS